MELFLIFDIMITLGIGLGCYALGMLRGNRGQRRILDAWQDTLMVWKEEREMLYKTIDQYKQNEKPAKQPVQ